MKLFTCPNCGNRLYFENTTCMRCGSAVGYDLQTNSFALAGLDHGLVYCKNAANSACNWLVESAEGQSYCLSCRLTEVIPPIGDPVHLRRWAKVEAAKRRLVYGLRRLRLAVIPRSEFAEGLAFRILVDDEHGGAGKVTMGHEDGIITIDGAEADTPERESRRVELQEPFRTMLGHMRHESAHYYWDRLIQPTEWLDLFRAAFGDERADYAEAMQRYYAEGPPADWQHRFISAYASMHPWEDWAETWAHYLHMVDAVETASEGGLWVLAPPDGTAGGEAFDALYGRWLDVLLLMNSMNRSLGHRDFYPFVVSEAAREKLRFVHRAIASSRTTSASSD